MIGFNYNGTDYYYDVETKLYYLESRYYDPALGRFLNADALEYLGEGNDLRNYNLYAYCENNPVMYSDPSGTFILSLIVVGGITGMFIGATASVVSQGLTKGWNNIDLFQVGFDAFMGGISGAIGGSGIGVVGSMITGGILGFVGSVGSDLIANDGDFGQIDWGKAVVSGLAGGALGRFYTKAGAGNVKAMNQTITLGESWFSKTFINFTTSVLDESANMLIRKTAALYMANAILGYQAQALFRTGVGIFGTTVVFGLWS